jgi:hypothetical protein
MLAIMIWIGKEFVINEAEIFGRSNVHKRLAFAYASPLANVLGEANAKIILC